MEINSFSFLASPQLRFGPGKISILPELVKQRGNNILLITGKSSLKTGGKLETVVAHLTENGINYGIEVISREPTPEDIDSIVELYRDRRVDIVVSVGGGSVIDAGKAISAMIPQVGSVRDYLEGVGTCVHNGKKIPFIAVPTTAGTGSEATKNAVISEIGINGFKRSLRHDNFVPDVALIDPELMLGCPADISAASGLDALTQLIESYVSPKSSLMTDILALSGIESIRDSILDVCNAENDSVGKRALMAYGSYISGVTLLNAGLGAVHGFASSIGGFFDIPHGVICGTLVGVCTEKNINLLKKAGDIKHLDKYAKIGYLLVGKTYMVGEDDRDTGCKILLDRLNKWIDVLDIPKLGKYGVKESDIDRILDATENKNNPVELKREDFEEVLRKRI